MPDRFLNLGLLSHPLNWITLTLWIVFLAILIKSADPMLKGMYPSSSPSNNGASN